MKRTLFFVFFVATFYNLCNAQITVSSNNYIGIGTSATSPLSLLSVGGNGSSSYIGYFYNPTTTGAYNIGIGGFAFSSSGRSYGLYGYTSLTSTGGLNYGGYGCAYSSTALSVGRAYGLFGIAGNGISGYNYAVYGQLLGSNNGADRQTRRS